MQLELVILGCWAPYPRAGGACSGYLVRGGGTNILLEAGNGSLSRLRQFIDFCSLDAAVVTHFHPDHYLDLFLLKHAVAGARREGRRDGALKLFLPSRPKEIYGQLSGFSEAFTAVSIEELPRERLPAGIIARRAEIGGLLLHFVPALHSMPGYSLAVTGKGRLVYSGDTARTAELTALAAGSGLFLCEASGLDSDADYLRGVHLTAREAGAAAAEAGAERLLITHFWPEYDLGELARQAAAGFGRGVLTAREGDVHEIS